MNEKEYYTDRIYEMIAGIKRVEWLEKIFCFVKVFAEDKKGHDNNFTGRKNGRRRA